MNFFDQNSATAISGHLANYLTTHSGPPVKKKGKVPKIFNNLPQIKKNQDIQSVPNLPPNPITKLKSWMRRISRQWAGGKVHGLDIGT